MTIRDSPCTLSPAPELKSGKSGLSEPLEEHEHTLRSQVRRPASSSSIFPSVPSFPRSVFNFFKRTEKKVPRSEALIQPKRVRELNPKHSSINDIPNELLLHIFQLFCSSSFDSGYSCPQIILEAVSSDWRVLVKNAPELWETFSVRATDETLQMLDPLLRMYCNRRGYFPGFIQIDLERLDYLESNLNGNILESLIPLENGIFASEGSTQITSMKLRCPPLHWIAINAANCSNLQELSLSYTSQNIGTFSWSSQIRLGPLPNLRVLRLDNVPITLCFELLQACTGLIEFHCTPLISSQVNTDPDALWNDGHSWMIERPRIELVYPKLKHLTWTLRARFWDNYFLRFYRFPNLRVLSWPIWLGQHSREQFDTFVSALPEDLETFEMIYISSPLMPWCRYQRILERVPRAIKCLVFRGFPSSSHARLLEMSHAPTLFPSLTAVEFTQ